MSRAAANQAQQTYNTSNALEGSSAANTNALYNQLTPAFTNEVVNPQGFGSQDMADLTTGAEQSAGGTLGSVAGKAAQYSAANRNLGSFAPTLDEASRAASRQLGSDTLGIKGENAMLKQSQQQAGLAGLAGEEGMENNDVLSSLGLQNQSTNALTNASPGWVQNTAGILGALRGAGASSNGSGGWAVTG